MAWQSFNRVLVSVGSTTLSLCGKRLVALGTDESGGEVLEYALIAGLIVVAAIATIGAVGTKVLGYWGSINSSM